MKNFFVFAGEASGDLYGGRLVAALKNRFQASSFFGVGGPELQSQGLTSLIPIEQFQVMGFSDVYKNLPRLIKNFISLKKACLKQNPDACIFIDQPAFSIRFARALRKAGYTGKIIQAVAPTVWAYKPQRAAIMAKYFDLLLPLFSFEVPYFTHYKVPTIWTGHPLIEYLQPPTQNDKDKNIISIFPGSRPSEVVANLPMQLEGVCQFAATRPGYSIAISVHSETVRQWIEKEAKNANKKFNLQINLTPFAERHDLMRQSCMAVAKSGTVTLELALSEVPTIVTYHLSPLNRFIAKHFLHLNLPYYCIVNILKGKELFKEYIEHRPLPEDIAQTLSQLQNDAAAIRKECRSLRSELTTSKEPNRVPSKVAADAIVSIL